jgi:hypothetical protein
MVHRRTGREYCYNVSVATRGVAGVHAYVRPVAANADSGPPTVPAGTVAVSVHDFPSREREAVRKALSSTRRRELASRLLGVDTLHRVASGDVTLLEVALAGLAEELSAIASDPSATRARRAAEFVDLVELLGRRTPFDAQSAFARAMAALDPETRAQFAELSARLGFAADFVRL